MARRLRFTPYARLCLSFAVLVLAGWLALMVPGMSRGQPVTWLDALFTATSAVCVTGLTVRGTGSDWTLLGQCVILLLIQLGGIGFMTLSSSVFMNLRKRAGLEDVAVIRASLGGVSPDDLPSLLKRCLQLVLYIEGAGALLLFARFFMDAPTGLAWFGYVVGALWAAVFHSISAFCNAGFSIWDDSLVRYTSDFWVNGVIMGLVILGGIGFFVLTDLDAWVRARKAHREHRVRFQTRLVLGTSLALILIGALLLWIPERNNALTLADRSLPRQALACLFHSVSARTAGFNTVEIRQLTVPAIAVLIGLMFIGASPGSCGGGVKTTTVAVLFIVATTALRGRREPTFHGRTFGRETLSSAIVLFFAAMTLVIVGAVFLFMIEAGNVPLEKDHGKAGALIFETTSAFATVGLSTGETPHLRLPSKLCLIFLMYLGRVGPLGLMSASLRGRSQPVVRYPREDIQVG